MFPLKRRRKFARIYKEGLTAKVTFDNKVYTATVNDISASGCNILLKDSSVVIPKDEVISVEFILNEVEFEFNAKNVRENAYNFLFENRELQAKLNNIILTEYFKDTPELIPVDN